MAKTEEDLDLDVAKAAPVKTGGKKKMIIIVVAAVVLLAVIGGGAWFFLKKSPDASADTEATSADAGKQDAKSALDKAVQRGNELIDKFARANKGS